MRINAMNRTLLFIIAIALLACGCTRRQPSDPRLQRLTLSVDTGPQAVIDSLVAIDPATLGEFDRHYYNFLTVKARDKAYIVHTSDSLILDVINHFGHSPKMAEALYYAGRVYSDLGDYPTALRYFQDALEQLPEDTPQTDLRNRVLSQTGRLLARLQLYSRALPFAEEALTLSINAKDTVNIFYGNILVGNILVGNRHFDAATKHYRTSLELARITNSPDTIEALSELAIIEYHRQNYSTTYQQLRSLYDKADINELNYILYHLALSCIHTNRPDSALYFAKQMLLNGSSNNIRGAYYIMTDPMVRSLLPNDSVDYYIDKYTDITEQHYADHDNKASIIQATMLDYAIHERKQIQAERKKGFITSLLYLVLTLLLAALLIASYFRYRYIKSKNDLLDVNTRLNILTQSLSANNTTSKIRTFETRDTEDEETKVFKHYMEEYLKSLDQLSKKTYLVPLNILESDVYAQLQYKIAHDEIIKDNDIIWEQLHATIRKASPDFDKKIHILSGGQLNTEELHTILLIKTGIRPSIQCRLFGRHLSTITNRRTSIGKKLIGKKCNPSTVDALIQNL